MKKIPLNVTAAMITLKEFCKRQLDKANDITEYCKDCPFNIEGKVYERECYFEVETPDNWEIEHEL